MKPQLGFTTLLVTKNIIDDFKFAAQHNFNWVEICLDWQQNFKLSDKAIKEIKTIASKNDLQIIIHTPYYLPTATVLPELKNAVIENIKKGMSLAEKIGSERITVHPGYRELPGPAANQNYLALTENLKEITSIAKDKNLTICLENFNNCEGLMCVESKEVKEVLKNIPGLKMTLDVGHANTTNTSPDIYFKEVKDYIMDMHIHDNSGKIDEHSCIGEGSINFKKLFNACKEANYNGPFVLELFPHENILKGKNQFLKIWNS